MPIRVIEGPTTIGNSFGYYGSHVPEGKFAVVRDGEYANGGCGPSTVDGIRYGSRARAEQALAQELEGCH